MRLRLLEDWNSFCAHIFPDERPSAIQSQEMRRAFYAGARAFQYRLLNETSNGDEVEQQDLDLLTELDQELKAFAKDVVEGRA